MAFLTVREVASRLRLHEMTVRRHIREGRMRAVRVGRRIRIPEDELGDFVRPEEGPGETTPQQLRDQFLSPPAPRELERRHRVGEEMRLVRQAPGPGAHSAVLLRVARRSREVLYGNKTWEELIAEES
jgi:excisionase family DNA binding protein